MSQLSMTQHAQPQVVPIPQPRFRRRRRVGVYSRPSWASYAILSLSILLFAYPLWWSVVVASGTNATRGKTLPLIPEENFFRNAQAVLDSGQVRFWTALGNTVIIATVVTISVVTFSTLAGYAFAKLRFRGRDQLMIFVIATMAIPTQLGIIPLFMIMKNFGWVGTNQAVIVPVLVTAFSVFFMRQYLAGVIPDELIEAARVDGANQIRIVLNVAVPAARPAMAIIGLFTFMMAWTDFLWPMIVQAKTLQVALSALQSGYYIDYSIVLAGAVLATIPLLILFLAAGRQLIAGIMQGAIKG